MKYTHKIKTEDKSGLKTVKCMH